MDTLDIAAMCAEQDAWCEQMYAEAERRRAETPRIPPFSEQERAESLSRTARDFAAADVRLERAVLIKRRADHELRTATTARQVARDTYKRAVTRCASAPYTSTTEENPRT